MEVDWTTVIFELINFGVLALLLTRFLFKPVRALLLERKREVAGAHAEAEAARSQSEAAKLEFERRRAELDGQAGALRSAAKAEAEALANQLIEAGRAQVQRARAALADELERARVDALHRLSPDLIELTHQAGRRMLLDMHAGDVAVAFARNGARRLREALGPADSENARTRRRVRAFVSPDADLSAVSLVLEEAFGDADVELDVDASLVGGVKLTADGIEVEASAGASLGRWLHEQIQAPLSAPNFTPGPELAPERGAMP